MPDIARGRALDFVCGLAWGVACGLVIEPLWFAFPAAVLGAVGLARLVRGLLPSRNGTAAS